MSRHLGVGSWLAATAEVAEPLFAVLTQVGSTWFLGALALLSYVLGDALPGWDRRRGAAVLAAVLAAIALIGLLKTALALPRPAGADTAAYSLPGLPGDIYTWAATADGYGVPSGHALGATAVYGTIAALADTANRGRLTLAAVGLVAVSGLSRLALGVHLLVDVVTGVGVGLVVVWGAARWVAVPRVTVGLAVSAAAGWALLAGGDPEAVGALAVSLGALLAWSRYGNRLDRSTGLPTAALAVSVLLLASLSLVAAEVGGFLIAAGAGVVGMGAAVSLPLIVD